MRFHFYFVLVAGFIFSSCGDPTDDPEDCTQNEYFDESKQLCLTCEAIEEPDCGEGCAFQITRDDNGCAVAECDLSCTNTCGFGQYYSAESLACEVCDSFEPGPSDCSDLGCSCELIVPEDGVCAPRYCGACTDATEGWSVTDEGMCVQASDA